MGCLRRGRRYSAGRQRPSAAQRVELDGNRLIRSTNLERLRAQETRLTLVFLLKTRAETRFGEVAEWLKAHAWKACIRETVSRVRIPLSPPASGPLL